MSELLKTMKEKSKTRRIMMAEIMGFSDVSQLSAALNNVDRENLSERSVHDFLHNEIVKNPSDETESHTDTETSGERNDYSRHFVDTGKRPQNFIQDVHYKNRFEESPKLKELIDLKDELVQKTATPPTYLKCDLSTYDLQYLRTEFDVILVEPPLEEYRQTLGVTGTELWDWEKIIGLELGRIAADRSFIFLWCGSSDGLDKGRDCLSHWGFKCCEDICWIKTNVTNSGYSKSRNPNALFQRTKEHCLMGIKGTIHPSTDGDYVHSNIDTDVIVSEESVFGSMEKPDEIFNIIEHLCLGNRRLHLFGRNSTLRPGWLTLGNELTHSNFNSETYNGYFKNGQLTTGCTDRIEELRPKSPFS